MPDAPWGKVISDGIEPPQRAHNKAYDRCSSTAIFSRHGTAQKEKRERRQGLAWPEINHVSAFFFFAVSAALSAEKIDFLFLAAPCP